jgi:hypothetical protein
MDVKPISAVDAIGPAVERTKNFMFRPFQWARWWRIGLLGLATGEFASTGGCNPSSITDVINAAKRQHPQQHFTASPCPHLGISPAQMAAMITVLVIGIMVLVFVHLYVSSVLRFVLFDAAAAGRYRLREGWGRWHSAGIRYFLFQLCFLFLALAGYALLLGVPGAAAWSAGVFRSPHEHAGLLALGVIILLPLLIVYAVAMALVNLFVKDFAVPMMALENMPVTDALSNIWQRIKSAKGEYAGYVGIKVVLAIAIGIAMAIVQFFILLVLLVPVIVAAIAIGIATPAVFQNPLMLAFAITSVFVLILFLLFVVGIISAPIVYFFQAYVLTFFSSRYPPLWNLMHPAPPIPSPPPIQNPPAPADPGLPTGDPPEPFLAG